jgi:hypothetical protein
VDRGVSPIPFFGVVVSSLPGTHIPHLDINPSFGVSESSLFTPLCNFAVSPFFYEVRVLVIPMIRLFFVCSPFSHRGCFLFGCPWSFVVHNYVLLHSVNVSLPLCTSVVGGVETNVSGFCGKHRKAKCIVPQFLIKLWKEVSIPKSGANTMADPATLPTSVDIGKEILKQKEAIDETLWNAEVRRRAAVWMATELVEGTVADAAGVQVVTGLPNDLSERPDSGTRFIRFPPEMLVPYQTILTNPRQNWADGHLREQAQKLFDACFARFIPKDRPGPPHLDVCRISGEDLERARVTYNSVRGQCNRMAGTAEKRRYMIQFLYERNGQTQEPSLQREFPRFAPDHTAQTAKSEKLYEGGAGLYKEYVETIFRICGVPQGTPLPAPGVARPPAVGAGAAPVVPAVAAPQPVVAPLAVGAVAAGALVVPPAPPAVDAAVARNAGGGRVEV